MRMKTWNWLDNHTGEPVTSSEQEIDSGKPVCPKCGKCSQFTGGWMDQDFQGNDIRGWWFTCDGCGISTEKVEGYYNTWED